MHVNTFNALAAGQPSRLNHIPLSRDALRDWLRADALPGISRRQSVEIIRALGDPALLFTDDAKHGGAALVNATLRCQRMPDPMLEQRAHAIEQWCQLPGHHVISLLDPAYPPRLLCLADPPLLLYVAGDWQWLHRPAIAIIGSRHPTQQGLENTDCFTHGLIDAGWTIVSGMALGIDARAHAAALPGADDGSPPDANDVHSVAASTIAVIGTGIDVVYPARHQSLARKISASGAMISEWPLGTPARPAHFPQRNRLIAALAHGVLVVEATLRSGSLITARLANDLGRDIFAIPGSIHSPLSRGAHALIKDGAKLVEVLDDILIELPSLGVPGASATSAQANEESGRTAAPSAARTDDETALLACLGHDPATPLALSARSGWSAERVAAALTRLEIDGTVEHRAGRYLRCAAARQT